MKRDRTAYQLAYGLGCFIIAGTFLAGYHKILYPADFALAVYRFHMLPGCLVNAAALFLPWLEAVCAVCLLFVPKLRIPALWIALGLLLVFTAAIGINLWRGSLFGCGCFGRAALDEPLSWLHLVRNAGLIVLAGVALLSRKKLEGAAD